MRKLVWFDQLYVLLLFYTQMQKYRMKKRNIKKKWIKLLQFHKPNIKTFFALSHKRHFF